MEFIKNKIGIDIKFLIDSLYYSEIYKNNDDFMLIENLRNDWYEIIYNLSEITICDLINLNNKYKSLHWRYNTEEHFEYNIYYDEFLYIRIFLYNNRIIS